MIPEQQHVSGASFRRTRVGRKRFWGTDLLFRFLLVIDVFAICYWPTSRLGELLVQSRILGLKAARVLVLVLSAFLTPAVIRGMISLLKEENLAGGTVPPENAGASGEEGWRTLQGFRRITGGMDTCFNLESRDQLEEAA